MWEGEKWGCIACESSVLWARLQTSHDSMITASIQSWVVSSPGDCLGFGKTRSTFPRWLQSDHTGGGDGGGASSMSPPTGSVFTSPQRPGTLLLYKYLRKERCILYYNCRNDLGNKCSCIFIWNDIVKKPFLFYREFLVAFEDFFKCRI